MSNPTGHPTHWEEMLRHIQKIEDLTPENHRLLRERVGMIRVWQTTGYTPTAEDSRLYALYFQSILFMQALRDKNKATQSTGQPTGTPTGKPTGQPTGILTPDTLTSQCQPRVKPREPVIHTTGGLPLYLPTNK